MKRLFCLLLLCSVLLSGCFLNFRLEDALPSGFPDWDRDPADTEPTMPVFTFPGFTLPGFPSPDQPSQATEPAVSQHPTEPATSVPEFLVISVTFEVHTQDLLEYARIIATDENGNTVWVVETDRYEQAQLPRVCEVGPCHWKQKYYYVDDGDVVALDLQTGFELWRYAGFGGSPAGKDATYIDSAGTVYLCGFFGPDYFAIDADGNMLDYISELHPDYYWAHKLIPGDGVMTVCFSGGPEGDMGPEAVKIDVSTYGYPQVIYGAEP